MQRRTFIQLIAATSFSTEALSAGKHALTVAQAEGPFYPVEPIPASNNLLLSDQYQGSELQLSGRVLDRNGQALPQAKIEIWQCDGRGVYLHPRAPDTEQFDRAFQGFGATVTDTAGQYDFKTIVPVPYTGRPPHIHAKLFFNNKERLTSQIYLRDSGGHKKLKTDLTAKAGNIYTATFDFVIKT